MFLRKLINALRNGRQEPDSYEELNIDVTEAEKALSDAKSALGKASGQCLLMARNFKALQDDIKRHEKYAMEALSRNDEKTAREISGRIAELEKDAQTMEADLKRLKNQEGKFKATVQQSARGFEELKRQAAMIRTVGRMQQAAGETGSGSISSARQSLENLAARSRYEAYKLESQEALEKGREYSDPSLEAKLKKAGIINDKV